MRMKTSTKNAGTPIPPLRKTTSSRRPGRIFRGGPLAVLLFAAAAGGLRADIADGLSPEERRAVEAAYAEAETSPRAAAETLRSALREPVSPAARFFLAERLRQAGRPEEALEALRAALESEPALPEAATLAAHLLLDAGRPAEAADLLAPLRQNPSAPLDTWMLSAHAWLAAEQPVETEIAARHVLARAERPEMRRNARILLLHALTRQRRAAEAAALCAAMLRETPLDSALWRTRIQLLDRAGTPGETLAALETARALEQADAEALRIGARIRRERNDPARALALLLEAARRDPETTAPALNDLIGRLEQTADPEALSALDTALRALPRDLRERPILKSARDRLQAARLFHEGALAAALERYDEIARQFPRDGFVLLRRGDLRERLGRRDEAALDYERAAAIAGFEAPALLRLASLRAEAGRYAEAAEAAERALRHDRRESLRAYRDRLAELAAQDRARNPPTPLSRP